MTRVSYSETIDRLTGTDFVWRGNAMSIAEDAEPVLNEAR
jgi:hypothetical protein